MSPVSLVYHTEVTVTRLFTGQYNCHKHWVFSTEYSWADHKGYDMITYVVLVGWIEVSLLPQSLDAFNWELLLLFKFLSCCGKL